MQVHHYDRRTGEYEYSARAKIDPAETLRVHRRDPHAAPCWLVPAHATLLPPPDCKPGFARVFRDGGWVHVADHRGETWIAPGSGAFSVAVLGDPAACGFLPLRDPRTIALTRRGVCRAVFSFLRAAAKAA